MLRGTSWCQMPAQSSKFSFTSFLGKLAMLVIGAILAGVGSYIFSEYIKPKPIFVNIQVFDDSDAHKPIKDASVWLGLNDVENKRTGDFGLVRFEVPRKHRKESVTPKIELAGYSKVPGKGEDKFVLDRSEMNFTYILKRDTPPTAEFDRNSYSSGARSSGAGDSFSQWYELCNDPKPGWVISESSFTLTGDRQCNAWSECRQSTNEPTKVCWQFRMQGHKEQTGGFFNQGNTGIQFSTGVLSVLWRKQT
jgi:hypothetical protein